MPHIHSIENTEQKQQLLKEMQLLKETTPAIMYDITRSIQTEQELNRLNQELLYKTNQLKGLHKELHALAHIAGAHLKEPLRKIYSYAEIALRDEGASMTSRAKSYCRKIQAAAQKMSLLTDDIAALTLIDPEAFKREETDLNIVLLQLKNQMEHQLQNKSVTLQAALLPVIQASEILIFKLFHSIIHHYIRVKNEDLPWVINIAGSTIEGKNSNHPAAQDRLYHCIRFSLTGNTTEPAAPPLLSLCDYAFQDKAGMELPLSKKICEVHGGFMKAENTSKEYTFSCYFPMA